MRLTEISWEINMFYRKILEYSLIVSQVKADSWRFETARERYNMLMHTHPEVIKRAPLSHIASYLLMTPETLSRAYCKKDNMNLHFFDLYQIIFPKNSLTLRHQKRNRISFYKERD